MKTNSITITYLSKVSFASLNGADKDVDNINPIKKITLSNGQELPYVSSQALRRALRDILIEMGFAKSEIQEASAKKGAPKTQIKPFEYIEDDLFGYMDASPAKEEKTKGTSTVRTSPIRVEALVALSDYKGDLDYATNFMGKGYKTDKGEDIQPNIFETEVHSGVYRGTILIELDRIGSGQGFEGGELSNEEKARRVLAFLDAFQNLWSSGRQTRFLADISPKFIAAACMKVKNPIFLEAVNIGKDGRINFEQLKSVLSDYERFIQDAVFAGQEAVFELGENVKNLKEGFATIANWIKEYYK
ncbi:type I-B CRISPR-associated protein Cas7/Cst2/DevR [Eisenibacter elegans]|jgi:CRISPR-associated protein Cst2|uniref:type I-B CRISPR-associated protein Cas7/Cst2/DevR n=1 Tax=Eisenibacter elegans TaxID=997 RepID=UPI0003F6C41B|nr:type I-B CRISPR-associated protein Cas7/Cst2/DevR [Eisenibacter elegans]